MNQEGDGGHFHLAVGMGDSGQFRISEVRLGGGGGDRQSGQEWHRVYGLPSPKLPLATFPLWPLPAEVEEGLEPSAVPLTAVTRAVFFGLSLTLCGPGLLQNGK